jgi:hypothetical protein
VAPIDIPVDDVLAQAAEHLLVSRHRVDGVVPVDDEQSAQLAVVDRGAQLEGAKPPLDEGEAPTVGHHMFGHRFEATGNRGAQQLSSRAEVVVDVAAIDPGTLGDLAEVEAGQHPLVQDEVEGDVDQSTLGFGPTSLCLRSQHRSA